MEGTATANLTLLGQKEYSMNKQCECSDPLCPHCEGRCVNDASYWLASIGHYSDEGWNWYACEPCAEDALESGIFVDVTETAPE